MAGALSDGRDRRTILIATQSLQAAIAGTAASLTAIGAIRIWVLVVIALAMGMVFAVDAPARQVYVLELVGGEHIAGAISINEVALNASRAVGPAFGGVVIAVTSVWVCFGINALSFLPTLAFLVRQPQRASSSSSSSSSGSGSSSSSGSGSRRPAWRTVWAGACFALARPAIRACLLMAVTAGAALNISVVAPLLATRVFHVGGAEYGLMLAAFGVGAVPGAVCAAASGPTPARQEVRRLGLAVGIAVLACAFAPTYPLMLVGIAAVGAVLIWFIARANALVLLSAEPSMRGRVMGVWSAALPGMNPITGLAVGASADAWGPRAAYAGVGLAAVLTAVAAWRALRRAGRSLPERPAHCPADAARP